jgi:hypothetical protein
MEFTRCSELIEHTFGKMLVRYYLSSCILYYIHKQKASSMFAQNISKFKHIFLYTMHKFLGLPVNMGFLVLTYIPVFPFLYFSH